MRSWRIAVTGSSRGELSQLPWASAIIFCLILAQSGSTSVCMRQDPPPRTGLEDWHISAMNLNSSTPEAHQARDTLRGIWASSSPCPGCAAAR